jgi:hypothetical protein
LSNVFIKEALSSDTYNVKYSKAYQIAFGSVSFVAFTNKLVLFMQRKIQKINGSNQYSEKSSIIYLIL